MGCCDRDCCNPKRGAGKCLVFFFAIAFGLGVIVSTSSPNWISFSAQDASNAPDEVKEVQFGPFYGMSRTCVESRWGDDALGGDATSCSSWETTAIDLSDCEKVDDPSSSTDLEKLCNQMNTWRSLGIACLCLVLIGGMLVFAASCCQIVTCGCCGNSLTCISNVLFWIEVILSIVCWSFAISSLHIIKDAPAVTKSGYEWGFWVFIATGTVVGALAAWMADWAAEDSCLRGVWHCITCRSCRKGDDDAADDDKVEPLIGDSSGAPLAAGDSSA